MYLLKKSSQSLESTVFLVYISAAHSIVQLPVLTLIVTIFWEATSTNIQG